MERRDEQTELDLRLFRVWRRASAAVFGRAWQDVESRGLAPDSFMVLELLYNKGPHSVQRLCEALDIPSGSITYVVDKLEKKGLARRQPNPNDRRGSHVTLTPEGEALFDDVFPKHAASISRSLSFLGNEEKAQLIEWLKQIGLGASELQVRIGGENKLE